MEAFEPVLRDCEPQWVVVVGDVNSTLACALVAAKLRPEIGCRIAHVEAGLRSHDWRMPEEVNRVLTDRLADLLLTPSRDAHRNLAAEGIDPARVAFVGNVMIDSLFAQLDAARALDVPTRMGLERGRYAVATVHRPSNVDEPDVLAPVLRGLARVAGDLPLVFPMHPRTRARADEFGLHGLLGPVRATLPLGYREMVSLVEGAGVVLTDSGGVQEETTALGVPCVTLREQTERPVTVLEGTNRLAPWPLTADGIYLTFRRALAEGRRPPGSVEGWDGRAGERIAAALADATPGARATAGAGTGHG
jgi:UDP-N-acetylglucosamine 2-epimerase (non-hydrolysing)